jgi:PAS domain-containing protein
LESALDPPLVTVTLHNLPVAAAALDWEAVIVTANHPFLRLCGGPASSPLGQRLSLIVADSDRPILEEALQSLMTQEKWLSHRCDVRALRASPPALWLGISVVRLPPESPLPYFACLQAISRRRRTDRLPQAHWWWRRDHRNPSRNSNPSSTVSAD